MTYLETINYLYNCLPAFHREGATAYKPGLDRTICLDNYLGQPHRRYKTIHVAGTNGKGSVSHTLAAILQSAGYTTGLYTSPHLKDFRERIRVNGEMIAEQAVIDFVEQHRSFFESLQPSFFEVTSEMAFDCFAREKVDVAVIEVGLGGRLDSTNIITPELCIITNISFDHMQFLGNTLPEIASEKAGIIKSHVPVVIGDATGEVKAVFLKKAFAEKAPVIFAEDCYRLQPAKTGFSCAAFPALEVELKGSYQQKNTATALAAVEQLNKQGFDLTEQSIRQGFAHVVELTGLQGRWQTIGAHPTIICDTAHNEAGIRYTMQQLVALNHNHIHIVFGMVNDKDVHAVLTLLPKNATYYFTQAAIPRALPAGLLQQQASEHGLSGNCYLSVQAALDAARKHAGTNDVIYVGGSTFVVAEVL